MLFSEGRLRGDGDLVHADTIRAFWPTVASPVTFAPPLDAREDDEGFTLEFDIEGHDPADVEVRVEASALVVVSRAMRRTFWLRAAVESDRAEVELIGDLLRVRLIKTQVAARRKIVVRRGP
jgi:HSP20 family molecular chaperone IbpA